MAEEETDENISYTLDEAENIVGLYEDLVERANLIWSFDNEEYVRVWFQDGKAYGQSARNERGYYGDSYLEAEQFSCDQDYFLQPLDKLKADLAAKAAERDRRAEQARLAYAQDRERQERAMYEVLKQKYGNKFGIF